MKDKTTSELIVEMLCDGIAKKTIKAELGLTEHYFNLYLSIIRRPALLPFHIREYKENKADILNNVAKYKAHKVELEKINNAYLASLADMRG